MKVKRYMVFAYDYYYPRGGWDDFEGSFDTLGEARAHCTNFCIDVDATEIIDSETGERIE